MTNPINMAEVLENLSDNPLGDYNYGEFIDEDGEE